MGYPGDEIERLRARVAELEAELARRNAEVIAEVKDWVHVEARRICREEFPALQDLGRAVRLHTVLSPTHDTLNAIEQAIVQAFLQDETATNRGAVITRAAVLVLAALQNLAGVPTSARGEPPDSGSGQSG